MRSHRIFLAITCTFIAAPAHAQTEPHFIHNQVAMPKEIQYRCADVEVEKQIECLNSNMLSEEKQVIKEQKNQSDNLSGAVAANNHDLNSSPQTIATPIQDKEMQYRCAGVEVEKQIECLNSNTPHDSYTPREEKQLITEQKNQSNDLSGVVEVGANHSAVSDDPGDWNGQYIAGEIQTDAINRWRGLYLHQEKFHEEGHYVAVGNVHVIDEDYYSDVTVGVGQGIIMQRHRVDAFLNRKWLDARNLVTTIGVGGSDSYSDNSDVSLFLGGSYYFDEPWIVQGGVRVNRGMPGNIISPSAFMALTQGRNNDHFVTLRYGFGREAYQVIGANNILSDFNSHIVSLNWKQWVMQSTEKEKGWGFNATSEYYDNPNYHRTGFTLGVFREF